MPSAHLLLQCADKLGSLSTARHHFVEYADKVLVQSHA